jgi:hypothetical protein
VKSIIKFNKAFGQVEVYEGRLLACAALCGVLHISLLTRADTEATIVMEASR